MFELPTVVKELSHVSAFQDYWRHGSNQKFLEIMNLLFENLYDIIHHQPLSPHIF